MQVSPWFSLEKADDEVVLPVYHNNACCAEGKRIDKYRHRYGTDNRPLCPQCVRLNGAGR
jgi:hypothetical protein